MRARMTIGVLALGFVCAGASVLAQNSVSLLVKGLDAYGWRFDNGREFPGAVGKLGIDPADGNCLRLDGDFSKGGNYVEASATIDNVDIEELVLRLKYPGADHLTIRVGDDSGQCHQINLKLKPGDDWQRIRFGLADFLARKGASPAAEFVARYENWGGAKDARWHGPAKYISVLIGPGADRRKPVALSLAEVNIAAAPKLSVIRTNVRLDQFPDGELDWEFINGQEFPGASGGLEIVKDGYAKGQDSLRFAGNFTRGGVYVAADKALDRLAFATLKFSVMSTNAGGFAMRLVDATGQCHQKKGFQFAPDGQWHKFTVKPGDFAGVEHWGGVNDGKWHAPATLLAVVIGADFGKTPVLNIGDMNAEADVEAAVQAAAFNQGFETVAAFPASWTVHGAVTVDAVEPFKGARSLTVKRDKAEMDQKASGLTLDSFPVKAGVWELSAAMKSSLYSPDSSYNGRAALDVLDVAGKTLNSEEIGIITGDSPWKAFKKRVDLPAQAVAARFVIQMNKTYGTLKVDELSAAYVAPSARANARVSRIKFSSPALGNLFLPGSNVTFNVIVDCVRPLAESNRVAMCVVRDYWGAEFSAPIAVKLEKDAKAGRGKRIYTGALDLSGVAIETGKYYEIHAEVAEPELPEPSRDKSAFAVLPEAVTKQYKPFEIPFTSRDWDNRIKEYFFLSDRLGVRVCGVWSGWSAKAPYTPSAPGIEWCKQLGMGALLGAPNWQGGTNEYSETALREGAKNMVNAYKDMVPILVTLGNEPHPANDAKCREMIASYKAVYEGVKAADSNILCIGTSCGPDGIFFKNGFQPYQDVYDFHVYEDPAAVTGAFAAYQKFFAQYPGSAKPIWSTETGLNSQGMTRHAITIDLVKKFALFFASGGVNMSWFDLLYPDPEGKRPGSNSESFDVFDSRFCFYAPKLDAIAYYNMVNGICIKKFVERRAYADGVSAFLFRDKDGQCLVVLWKDKGRQDSFVPLDIVRDVRLVRIDGSLADLDADGKGLTLTLSEDPCLLLFKSATMKLADSLGSPQLALAEAVEPVIKGGATHLAFRCDGVNASDIVVSAPLAWKVTAEPAASGMAAFALEAPPVTAAREARVVARLKNGRGEVSLAVPLSDRLTVRFVPVPFRNGAAGLTFSVRNNLAQRQDIAWRLSLPSELPMEGGTYKLGDPKPFVPAATGPLAGTLSVDGRATAQTTVTVTNFDALNLYPATLELTAGGKTVSFERMFGGFVGVPKAMGGVTFDGKLGDPAWQKAAVLSLDQARQYLMISGKLSKWKGPEDLSGKLRFLWDDKCLYLGMQVADDAFCNRGQDGSIWNGDGLQILSDPCRESAEKPGKYEYAFAQGQHGPQAWCNYSADPAAPCGEAKDIVVKVTPSGVHGDRVYELAIPWKRLAPFKPVAGGDLGMAVIINEDDSQGRDSFIGWFGCAHSKQIGMNGDLILLEE